MSFYELVYVARADLSPSDVDSLTDGFVKILEDGGGRAVSREYWGLRMLAYKINKNTKGHYVCINIDSPYAAVKELRRVMGFNENLIRHGIFRVEQPSTKSFDLAVSENAKDYRSHTNKIAEASQQDDEKQEV
ncbi:MAG: 30S ribosomal protein S6 [Rickettsiales bacterium]|jgi:small subunit ribosomal protein S6|nr:30S ribosomal protein S6 [Rickettsiales bacterium]